MSERITVHVNSKPSTPLKVEARQDPIEERLLSRPKPDEVPQMITVNAVAIIVMAIISLNAIAIAIILLRVRPFQILLSHWWRRRQR